MELEIPITPEAMAEAELRAFRRLVKSVRLPGFRPGKVPRKVFEATYGTAAITGEAVEDVVPEAYALAMREHALHPVERPHMEILEEVEGRPVRVKATVEVRPEIALGEYKGIAVEAPRTVVGDDDVERSLTALAKERATLVPVDRPAELGDVVTIDYRGTIAGEPFEGGEATGQVTELLEERFIPGFASGIAGMAVGDRRDVEARFPDEYPAAELAGKTVSFAVTLHEVKRLELPQLDDAFAASISSNATLAELRDDLRRRLGDIAQARHRRIVGNLVMERLLAAHEIPLPRAMVDAEIAHLAREAAEGESEPSDSDREQFRAEAETRVKGTLLIEAIAKAEQIAATPADVKAELTSLARQYGQPPERIRAALGSNLVALMEGIVRTKTIEFLVENAAVTVHEETSAPRA